MKNILTKNKKCPWWKKCRNGDEGCVETNPENCVRFMPLDETNLVEIDGTVEVPPDIDYNKFSQYFINWVHSMGWAFCGMIKRHEEEEY